MIKLQDFARQCGVTDRAIQKHLKTYADELEGLYQRKGPNGTWLTEEACEILRSKMKMQPIVVGASDQQKEIDRLQLQVSALQDKLIQAQERLLAAQDLIAEGQSARLALEASKQEIAKKELEAAGARQEAQDLLGKLDVVEREKEALKGAQDELQGKLRDEQTRKITFSEYWKRRRG